MPRTKGSKNGISRTPGYTAVGQRAKGQIIDGRYVYNSPSPLERPGTISAFNDKMLMKNSSKHASQAAGKAGEYQERSERAATKAALYGNSSGKPSGAGAQERPAIDYQKDKRFSQVDYSANDKALIQRLAERRKNSVSSNAATINAAIQKSKDRLSENRAALAKQQAQALAKAKLQRIAAKQKVAESEKGGTNDWQRMANATASANNIYNNLVQGKIQSAFIAGEVNKFTPKKWAHHSYIDAEKNTEKYKAKVKAKAKKFNDKLDKKRNKRKKAKKGIEALRKYR